MRVLIVGDLHEPVSHPAYLKFCKDIYKKYTCNAVIFIGDIADWHAVSRYVKEPSCPGPKDEYKLAREKIQKWYKAFPKAKVCIGNHDERPERLAKTVSIPPDLMKSYNDMWGTPGWIWDWDFTIDNVYYLHGTDTGGIHPAWNNMTKNLMSTVMGHCHARAGYNWKTTPAKRIFAMDVGCGIDVKAWQFVYGRHCKDRPILGCGVVINGTPYHEIMKMGRGETYDNKKFEE